MTVRHLLFGGLLHVFCGVALCLASIVPVKSRPPVLMTPFCLEATTCRSSVHSAQNFRRYPYHRRGPGSWSKSSHVLSHCLVKFGCSRRREDMALEKEDVTQ